MTERSAGILEQPFNALAGQSELSVMQETIMYVHFNPSLGLTFRVQIVQRIRLKPGQTRRPRPCGSRVHAGKYIPTGLPAPDIGDEAGAKV
jgi:hypothetical protein